MEKVTNGNLVNKIPINIPIYSLFDERDGEECGNNVGFVDSESWDLFSKKTYSKNGGISIQKDACLMKRKLVYVNGCVELRHVFGNRVFSTKDFMGSTRIGKEVVVTSRQHDIGQKKFIRLRFETLKDAVLVNNVFQFFSSQV